MTNFEYGLFSAFADIYTNLQIKSCFFYFRQCLWRKVQNFPVIQKRYAHNVYFTLKTKQLIFILVPNIVEKVDKFMIHYVFEENKGLLHPLTDYF